MTDRRLRAVYDAASSLFVSRGYAGTQVSEIAERAGIATGSVYNLFASKAAILHFVLLGTLDTQYLDRDIPLPMAEAEHEAISGHLARVAEGLFSRIESSDAGSQSFADMLSILFNYAADYQVAFNIINDSRSGLCDIQLQYRRHVERLHHVVLTRLLGHIERGEVRPVEMPELHIRNILEGIIWWAMYLPHQAPGLELTPSKAKRIALDVLKHAYMTRPG